MIKLSNMKRALLAGLMTTTLIGSTLTAYAADTTTPATIADDVTDDQITFTVNQTWDNDNGRIDLTKVNTSVDYKITEAPEETTDYKNPDYTGVSLTPASFNLAKDGSTQDLTFTADHAGVFTYKITADETPDTGYTYDDAYVIRAYVKWNADRSGLVTTITAQQGDNDAKDASVTFEHKYAPVKSGDAENPDGTRYDPPVQKTIKGDATTSKDTFTFKMIPQKGNDPDGYTLPMIQDKDGNYVLHDEVEITPDNEDPTKNIAEFGDLGFYKEGTYRFDVYEIDDNQDDYTYDTIVYTVIYTVTKVDVTAEDGTTTKGWKILRSFEINGETTDSPLEQYTFANTYDDPNKGGNKGDDGDGKKHDGGGSGSATLYKVNASTGERLAGATFVVTKTNGDYVTTITTDASGMASISSINAGTYRLKETRTPAGYQAEDRYIYFTVTRDMENAVRITNTKAASSAVQHIVAIKQWANVDGVTTPDSVTLELTKDGAATGVTQIASAENDWTVDFGLVPTDAEYAIVENNVAGGYAVAYEKAVNGSDVIYTVTNTYVDGTNGTTDHSNANTGDSSNMMLYAGIMGVAMICLAGWFVYERKNRTK